MSELLALKVPSGQIRTSSSNIVVMSRPPKNNCWLCREDYFLLPFNECHRPRSQNTAKEQALIPEKNSKRIRPRCHVSLEKSSKNYKPLEKWAKPNLTQASPPTRQVRWRVFSTGFPRGDPKSAEFIRRFDPLFRMAKIRGEGGVICGLI